MIWDLAAGPLISSSSRVEDQKPGLEKVKVMDLEQRIQQQVADWMTDFKIIGEYKNLTIKTRRHAQRERDTRNERERK